MKKKAENTGREDIEGGFVPSFLSLKTGITYLEMTDSRKYKP